MSDQRAGLTVIDKHLPPSERTDENLLGVLAIFDRIGCDSIVGNKRAEFEAEARKRALL